MSKLVDWYLVELRLRLNKSLAPDRIDEIVREAEAHLLESTRNRQVPGVSEEAAAEAAVLAYGSPDKVALGHLRNTRQELWGLDPRWWAAGGALLAIYCWNFHWQSLSGYFDNFGATWQNGLAGVAGVLGLALMVRAVRTSLRSCRLTITASTLAAAAVSIPLVSFWMIPAPNDWQGISRLHLSRDVPKVEKTVGELAAYQAYVERGIKEYAAARSAADLSPDMRTPALAAKEFGIERLDPAIVGIQIDHGGAFVVPREYGIFAQVDGRMWALETMARFEDAKNAWSRSGPKGLASLRSQHADFAGLLQNATAAESGRLFFFQPHLYLQTLIGTVVLLPGFLILDWIAVFTARPRRRWPSRALA